VYRKFVLDEVKDSNAIADGRQQAGAIWAEAEVSSPVHGTEQVGELHRTLVRGIRTFKQKERTLKSVFILSMSRSQLPTFFLALTL
jgi:hypothetical protein